MAPWPQRSKETTDVCHATIPCVDDPFLSACHSAPAARLAGSGRVGGDAAPRRCTNGPHSPCLPTTSKPWPPRRGGVWQPAQAGQIAAEAPAAWWTLYGDATLNALQAQAASGNQSIALSLARLRAAQAAVASSRASQAPTLGTTASASRARSGSQAADGSSNTRTSSSYPLGLNASWELDLGGRLAGTVDAAQATAQASADDLAAARLSVQASVAQTYFSLRAAEANAQILRETLQAYERSWELTRNRQQGGRGLGG